MSSKFSNKFPIPEKFPEILHVYAREVVRYMPKDILDFSIQYFYSLEQKITFNYIEGGCEFIPKSALYTPALSTRNTQIIFNQNKTSIKNNEEKDLLKIYIQKDKEENKKEIDNTQFINKDNNENFEKNKNLEIDKNNKENKYNKSGSTFSNISGSSEVKNGVRNFVRELMMESKNYVMQKENEKDN